MIYVASQGTQTPNCPPSPQHDAAAASTDAPVATTFSVCLHISGQHVSSRRNDKKPKDSRNNHRLRHQTRQCHHRHLRHHPSRRSNRDHRRACILTYSPRRRRPVPSAPTTTHHNSRGTYTLTVSVTTALLSSLCTARTLVSQPPSACLFLFVLVTAGSLTHVTYVGNGPPVVSAGGTPPRQSEVIYAGGPPAPRFSKQVEPESVK